MSWTAEDIPKLRQRRADLIGMIAHHEAGHPVEHRELGRPVNDPEADLADLKAKLEEVEKYLTGLGVELDV